MRSEGNEIDVNENKGDTFRRWLSYYGDFRRWLSYSPQCNPGARFAVLAGAGALLASTPICNIDRNCEQSQSPAADRAHYEKLTWHQLHEQRPQGGYRRKESEELLKARLPTRDAAEAKRKPVGGGDMDTSETVGGKREQAPMERAMDSDAPT